MINTAPLGGASPNLQNAVNLPGPAQDMNIQDWVCYVRKDQQCEQILYIYIYIYAQTHAHMGMRVGHHKKKAFLSFDFCVAVNIQNLTCCSCLC